MGDILLKALYCRKVQLKKKISTNANDDLF